MIHSPDKAPNAELLCPHPITKRDLNPIPVLLCPFEFAAPNAECPKAVLLLPVFSPNILFPTPTVKLPEHLAAEVPIATTLLDVEQ